MGNASRFNPDDLKGVLLMLGETGISMLEGMLFSDVDTIDLQDITYLPRSCLDGRLKKMIELKLVEARGDEFHLTKRGMVFLTRYWENWL